MSSPTRAAILSFFPAFTPPKSGGEARALHLWTAWAEHFDITAVSPTYPQGPAESFEHHPRLVEHRIPKKMSHVKWHQFLDRIGGFPECSALVVGLAGGHDEEFRAKAQQAIDAARLVIFEGPFFPYLRLRPDHVVVYNSYNVEHKLQALTWSGPAARLAVGRVKRWERDLVHRADLTFACSAEDRDDFQHLLGGHPENLLVVPNGTDLDSLPAPATDELTRTSAWQQLLRLMPTMSAQLIAMGRGPGGDAHDGSPARPRAIFMGSGFPPNVEAATLIEHCLAPAHPGIDFLIAGGCCNKLTGAPPPNVFRLGFIDEGAPKNAFLQAAHLAINPMLSGSGTNVKMLDFFGAGLPVLATPVGARGMDDFLNGRGLHVAPEAVFGDTLERLLGDIAAIAHGGTEARRLVVRDYQWRVIAERAAWAMQHRLAPRRVLQVVEYPIHPPDHGGKLRVLHQGRVLAQAGLGVTTLTLNKEDRQETRALGPGHVEVTIPRTPAHHAFDAELRQRLGGVISADDLSCHLRPSLLRPFERVLQRLVPHHRGAILCQPYLACFIPLLRRTGMLVHDSQNAEAHLKAQLFAPEPGAPAGIEAERARMRRTATECEAITMRQSDAVVATCTSDLEHLRALAPELHDTACIVAPNGVDCQAVRPASPGRRLKLKQRAGIDPQTPVAIFVGSAHMPNVDAGQFLGNVLAPQVPHVLFIVVGSVGEALQHAMMAPNVRLMGRVEDELKNALLELSDMSINPVETGSGTNLKLVEAMAAGLPVITTPMGARGTLARDGEHLLLCERAAMAEGIASLLADPARAAAMGTAARALAVNHYDWAAAMKPVLRLFGVEAAPADIAAKEQPPADDIAEVETAPSQAPVATACSRPSSLPGCPLLHP